ncbi:MAG: plasmid mobilization protein [Methylophilus sp.]
MKRRKFLKVAVTPDEYAKLSIEADKQGLTLSAYVRNQLTNKQQAVDAEQALARIEAKLQPAKGASTELEPLLVESVLLIRELVAEKNPQALPRVANRLNTQYPERRDI